MAAERLLLTLTGPSCAGKSVLQSFIITYGFRSLVSFTTRSQRFSELEGVDYFFIDRDRLEQLLLGGGIAEHISFGGSEYGILGKELETKLQHGNCVAIVEPNGVKQLSIYCKDNGIRHIAAFISNSLNVLVARFLDRYKHDSKGNVFGYTKRLIGMFNEEKDWIFAYDYDIIFNRFDSSNQEEVIKKIMEKINDTTSTRVSV